MKHDAYDHPPFQVLERVPGLDLALLKAMAGPARLAGLSQMHDFLARGFDAFRSIGGASEFLERIERRERAILEALYAGASTRWDEATTQRP